MTTTTKTTKKIRDCQLEAIQTEIDRAEGRAKERRLSAQECYTMLGHAMAYLHYPSRKALVGTQIICMGSTEKFPNAYRHTPMTTWVTFEADAKGWYFVKAERRFVRQTTASKIGCEIIPSESLKGYVISSMNFI